MPTLADIRGQARAVAVLRTALANGRVHHAYLFTGPAGSGKHTTGLALASALNCLEQPGVGCGRCDACHKIADGIHPDVITLEREGAAQIIPIEAIRARVLRYLGMAPHEGRARVILIEEAGSMQGPAANALLKTLEEPPAATHFVLGTTAPDQLLPTIRSRCQRVAFAALPPDLRAELAGDDDTTRALDEAVSALLAAVDRDDPLALQDAAAAAAGERAELLPTLELLAHRLHRGAREAADDGEVDRAAGLARRAGLVLEAQVTVSLHNAHGQLALDALLRRMRRIPA